MSSRMEEAAGSPQTVDEAREAVERSRQRISSTLDALEDRIVEKKHELKEKADVLRPVRDGIVARPFTAVAVGLGVGALLGSLGGGSDEDDRHRSRSGRERGRVISDDDRDELRRWRRQRRQRLEAITRRHAHERDRHRDDDEEESRFAGLRHQLMGAVTTAITAAVTSKVREIARNNISQLTGNGRTDDRHDRSYG